MENNGGIMKAVVVDTINEYSVQSVDLDKPKTGELLIKMAATGVCHSDLSVINGTLPLPLPTLVGHEGAGIVEEVGEGVVDFQPGDHVVLSFIPVCGTCNECRNQRYVYCGAGEPHGLMIDRTARVHRKGTDLNVMQFLGCMAEYAVVPAISAIKIDQAIPLDRAALVGCGVMTGVGAVINAAKVPSGSSVVVFGCGGVGLSIIQGARLVAANPIIAVDIADNKLDMAKSFGATHTINGKQSDLMEEIMSLTNGGADYAFEAVGSSNLMEQCYNSIRFGGNAIIVGVAPMTEEIKINALMASMSGKTLKGTLYGDANPAVDFIRLLSLYQAGRLKLDEMISKRYSIDEAPQAFEDMTNNVNARGVIIY